MFAPLRGEKPGISSPARQMRLPWGGGLPLRAGRTNHVGAIRCARPIRHARPIRRKGRHAGLPLHTGRAIRLVPHRYLHNGKGTIAILRQFSESVPYS